MGPNDPYRYAKPCRHTSRPARSGSDSLALQSDGRAVSPWGNVTTAMLQTGSDLAEAPLDTVLPLPKGRCRSTVASGFPFL